MLKIYPIHAFQDNYIWCIYDELTHQAVVVDPGDASPVQAFLKQHELELTALLITHHHPDHIGGLAQLKNAFQCPVYGNADANYDGVTHPLNENDRLEVLDCTFETIMVPGHTLDHIAFYSKAQDCHKLPWLFCGDTLFSAGCGRMFEGTPPQFHHSLSKFEALPGATQVYCAHEYTLANLKFARQVEPDNKDTRDYMQHCQRLRQENIPTVPSSLETERRVNPFLRCQQDAVIAYAEAHRSPNESTSDPVQVFATLRQSKDRF